MMVETGRAFVFPEDFKKDNALVHCCKSYSFPA